MKIAYTTVIACLCASHASSAPASGSLARLLAGEQPEAAAAAAGAAAPAKTVSSAPKASLASALRGVADAEEDRALTSSSAGTTSANSSGTQATSNSLVATNVSADDLEMAKARRNANVSVLPGNKDIKQREKAYKVSFDGILMYLPVTDLKWSYVASKIDAYGKVQLVIEFFDQGANLKKIASGAYDSKLRAFGKDAAKDGRQIYVRMLHEMNGDWYNWCAFFGDNTVGDFKNAYKHAVTVLRSTGANIKFQMSYAANNASKKKTPFKDFYVGDEYVDQVCTSAYNQCGATYPKNKSLEDVFGDFYTEVQTFTKRPICIAEMSSTGICKGKPAWISATWKSLATKFTRVSTINWFFENKKNLGRDWDLNTKADIHAFTSGYRLFRKVTGRRLEAIEAGASAEEADALALAEAEAHAAAEEDALDSLA